MFHASQKTYPVFIIILLLSLPLQAQTTPSLFSDIGTESTNGFGPLGIATAFPVTLNLQALQDTPQTLAVELPSSAEILIATLETFISREGFDETGSPLPGTSPVELEYSWIGEGQDTFSLSTKAS